jgi:hypothetical protein
MTDFEIVAAAVAGLEACQQETKQAPTIAVFEHVTRMTGRTLPAGELCRIFDAAKAPSSLLSPLVLYWVFL